MKFEEWWNNPVLKTMPTKYFSRREIVTYVADCDGGAHVDPALDEAYMKLSRGNALGHRMLYGSVELPMAGPELACIRQIAHEVLETLKVKAKDIVLVQYAV
ncbi:MAG: hypothetical protein ACOY33_09910 [Pseudomonadota bacterium]